MLREPLPKAPSGIRGLDEITRGGLPFGCPTLVCGPAGSGKTVFAIEFILRGAAEFGEPGVYFSFEESREKIIRDIKALGFEGEKLLQDKRIHIESVDLRPGNDAEIGDFDLSGLFIRLEHAISSVQARRVVIDGAEALLGSFQNQHLVRKELGRLLRWLDDRQVTSVITGEEGQSTLARHGFEEYLVDCVIYLDHRIADQLSTRRLRVVKYRGNPHSTDEFPFLIDEDGISVLPLTSIGLKHQASNERVSTGIKSLDHMFGGEGFFRGSSILVSGTAGTGKSSIAATFADAACRRGEKCLYFAFEESRDQICRNMRSIGLNLQQWVQRDLLHFETFRPTVFGLESHLANVQRITASHDPRVVIIDPITNFISLGTPAEVKNMLMRLIDCMKTRQITALFTSLTEGGTPVEQSSVGVSSLIDTWLLVRDIEMAGERNRGLYILKSRGMAHSNQIREFVITDHGLELIPVYVGLDGILIGSARVARESEEKAMEASRQERRTRTDQIREERRNALEAEVTALRKRFEAEDKELLERLILEENREQQAGRAAELGHRRSVGANGDESLGSGQQ